MYYEDEIDLYDIFDIFLKYKKRILGIIIVGFILSFGAALVARKTRSEYTIQEYTINYDRLESNPYYKMSDIYAKRFNINDVLKNEKYIDRFLEVPVLKELYSIQEGNNSANEYMNKRKFINKIIKLEGADSKLGNTHDRIKIQLDSKLAGASQIVDVYFQILNEEIPEKIQSLLEDKEILVAENNKIAETKLKNIEISLNKKLESGNSKRVIKNDIGELVIIEDPILHSEGKIYKGIYQTTSKELIGMSFLKRDSSLIKNIIVKNGSLLIERGQSKAKIVLLIGVFLSVALAFLSVFISEITKGYKEHKKSKKKMLNNK